MQNKALGLKRGIVKIVDYNPGWRDIFLHHKKNLLEEFAKENLPVNGIEHVGSTAIIDMKAKPIIDLMVAILNLDHWKKYQLPLHRLGYNFRKDLRIQQEHVLFVKGPEEERTHYLKLTQFGSDFWQEHIVFRDFLTKNPEYANEYEDLKIHLLEKYGGEREPYTEGKGEFIAKILRIAGYKGNIV